ncbi:MAG: hypothetical protein FH749_00360 [Firmicutes bacterium]|nr:hypothetical protein [Bacillota bacterium]
MDWGRTKFILILTFLILNLIFAFQLWVVPSFFDSDMFISRQQIDARVADLRSKNISISAQIPRRLAHRQMLTLAPPDFESRDIVHSIFGSFVQSRRTRYDLYTSSQGEIRVYRDGRVEYAVAPRETTETTPASALETARTFMEKGPGLPDDARHLRTFETEPGIYLVEFGQYWQRKHVPVSYLRFLVDGQGVLNMEYYWVQIGELVGENVLVIPSTGALMVAADYLPGRSEITDLYLSWFSRPLMAEEWRVPAVWVVETESEVLYINAYSGDLEDRYLFQAGNILEDVE